MKNFGLKIWVTVCAVAGVSMLWGKLTCNDRLGMLGIVIMFCLVFSICIWGCIGAVKDFLYQVALTKKRKQEEQEAAARKELAAAVCQILKSELK